MRLKLTNRPIIKIVWFSGSSDFPDRPFSRSSYNPRRDLTLGFPSRLLMLVTLRLSFETFETLDVPSRFFTLISLLFSIELKEHLTTGPESRCTFFPVPSVIAKFVVELE